MICDKFTNFVHMSTGMSVLSPGHKYDAFSLFFNLCAAGVTMSTPLKGDRGPTGAQGLAGLPGLDGSHGARGLPGTWQCFLLICLF